MACALPLSADTIYDNTAIDLNTRFNPGTNEVGDEILLAGTFRNLTNFSFEYWGTNTVGGLLFSGGVEARVRFYENDGTTFNGYATPGTMFYDSGPFSINPTPRSTIVFSSIGGDFPFNGLAMPVSSNMTWSVQFSGLGITDQAGVDLFSPPDVGGEHPDYWQNDAGVWSLKTNVVAMDFAARMDATVPEPSALSLVAIGAPILLAAARSLRRKQ
jgi:hypothetical protein